MALYVIATPIGNTQDISLRGLDILKRVETIILEERKEGTAFLRQHQITGKNYLNLNEHSTSDDLEKMLSLCERQDVALISDCGTPGFMDPGADLIRLCRQNKVSIHAIPGPSSLMTLLSLSSQKIDEFYYRGFLSAESEKRKQQWQVLTKETRAVIMMDTPYRLQKTLEEVAEYFPDRKTLIGVNLTQADELIIEDTGKKLKSRIPMKKAEFILMLYPHA